MKILGSILRFLFAWLDGIAAKLITKIYNLLLDLSNLILYSDNIVKVLGKRIGLILGIFMLFRIAITLINYLISPDQVKDSSKGGAKLIVNIVLSLTLLVTVNYLFNVAYKFQKEVVNSNIIGKIFFGGNSDDITSDADIGYYLYTGFLIPNNKECENVIWDLSTRLNGSSCVTWLSKNQLLINTVNDVRKNKDISLAFSYDFILAKDGGDFVFDYTPIISTAAGVVTILILISFCMDLATRAVKLLFLQIIAPIPIIANMDPSKGKDIFQKWYKECFSTYVSVFIRLIAINFAVFMITLIYGNFKDMFTGNAFLNVFIVIGCLMFAKQVPKLIEDMLGIKMDGMVLNPMKKLQEQALFGKQAAGLVRGTTAAAIGIGAGAIGAGIASANLGNGVLSTGGSFLRGAVRGAAGGLRSGYGSSNLFQSVRNGFGRFGTNGDYVRSLDGTTFGGRVRAALDQRIPGRTTEAENTKKQLEGLTNFDNAIDAAIKRGEAESIKYDSLTLADGTTMLQHKQMQEKLERMRNEQLMTYDEFFNSGGSADGVDQNAYELYKSNHDAEIVRLNDIINKNKKDFALAYLDAVENHTSVGGSTINDVEVSGYINSIKSTQADLKKWYSDQDIAIMFNIKDAAGNFSAKSAKDAKQIASAEKYNIEHEKVQRGNGQVNLYEQQQANANATKPKKKQ